MSTFAILLVSFCYTTAGIEQWSKGNSWFALMWICYAIANIALMKAGAT